jgi:hypothetical protein
MTITHAKCNIKRARLCDACFLNFMVKVSAPVSDFKEDETCLILRVYVQQCHSDHRVQRTRRHHIWVTRVCRCRHLRQPNVKYTNIEIQLHTVLHYLENGRNSFEQFYPIDLSSRSHPKFGHFAMTIRNESKDTYGKLRLLVSIAWKIR